MDFGTLKLDLCRGKDVAGRKNAGKNTRRYIAMYISIYINIIILRIYI